MTNTNLVHFLLRSACRSALCLICSLYVLLLSGNVASGQATQELVMQFRATPKLDGNLVRFGDVLEIRGNEEESKRIADLPLVPTPQPGTELRIKKEDILQQLTTRGYDLGRFRWIGGVESLLKPSAPEVSNGFRNTATMLPAYVTDRSVVQAERNLKDVISRYIALQEPNLSGAKMQFDIPKEHLHLLFQRRNIKRIGGGQAPWTGEQSFILQVQDKNDVLEIPIRSLITPPETYVVAVQPLRRGDIVEATDLKFQVIPDSTITNQDSQYFTDFKDIIGKQLRRSISSGQAIRAEDVGEPIVVEKNQLVQIKVIVGGIEVETAGRALTEGAVGDLVQVETINLKERKKLTAQVMNTNTVQVIASAVNATRR